ncbi:hypothetical protein M404DRAFT_1001337 [Pisolithus tinctorius Marx 270]|uniref:Uncharacterized protein n=1 Tax=Pisolithus tinctorius Marx 270 TaxID=870435 RepID=A0A0C3NRD9_PISTI|nr:hypothetical protein M404DRAFT_1001337 [Pisolithus tinctorius Marx 270]
MYCFGLDKEFDTLFTSGGLTGKLSDGLNRHRLPVKEYGQCNRRQPPAAKPVS